VSLGFLGFGEISVKLGFNRTDSGPCGLEKKHKVFLSHSGKDKAFVSHLDHRLRSVHHYPFFDMREDSLPLGDKIADIIFQASKQCRLAIVVVSDDFFMSKWPMLELASFVEAKDGVNHEMKILPLFYRLTVAEFKDPERQRVWFEKWERLKEFDERVDKLSWKNALRVLGGHNGAVYCGTGQTEDEFIENIIELVFRFVPPDILYDDSHVKGATHLRKVSSTGEDLL
jgi:hypothetical protein